MGDGVNNDEVGRWNKKKIRLWPDAGTRKDEVR